jgi:glycosyltransferase involved in cell wall biosynthesis
MAKTLIEQYPETKLTFLIAGDGPQKENIIDWINELDLAANVKLLGHVNQVPELLSALDIFVLSSDSKEGVPQSVMQALLMNKAVVSTDSGSTQDLLYQDNFQLVETNSVNSLINGVIYNLEREKIKNTREFIVSNFSKGVMTKKIMNIYQELVS